MESEEQRLRLQNIENKIDAILGYLIKKEQEGKEKVKKEIKEVRNTQVKEIKE